MNKDKLILVGGGGHCKSCIDVIEQEGKFEIAGIVDLADNVGKTVLGYPIISDDSHLKKLSAQYSFFLVTVGQLTDATLRKKLFAQLRELKVNLPTIISPSAYVSPHAKIGKGTIIMHQAIVNAAATIGDNCILNTQSLVEHDSVVGNHTHLATKCTLNGESIVGNECFIGSNAVMLQGIKLHDSVNIGAGAIVTCDIGEPGTYLGIPAKKHII